MEMKPIRSPFNAQERDKRGNMKALLYIVIILGFAATGPAHSRFISEADRAKCFAGETPYTIYLSKTLCGEDCMGIPEGKTCDYLVAEDNFVDDLSKPIYSGRNDVESCQEKITWKEEPKLDENGDPELDAEGNPILYPVQTSDLPICSEVLEAKVCTEPTANKYIDEGFTQVYCTHITGYDQKIEGKKLVEDSAKKASFDAKVLEEKNKSQALSQAKKAMECGKTTQALVLVRNASKGLTKPQVKQMVKAYEDIKNLLDTGSLESAVEEIQAVVADGVLITEEDKAALIAQIAACKP
jgi:hypothetical protein